MRSNIKRLLIGGLAAAVLGGIYAGLQLLPEQKTTEPPSVSLMAMDTDKLASVQISLPDETYTLQCTHDDSGTAYTMSGEQTDYSQNLLQELMDAVCDISARPVEESCDDLSPYGLSEHDSTCTATITDTDDHTTVLTLGLSSDVVGGTYCMKNGSSAVYLLDSDTASALTQPQSYYRSLTVLGSYYSLSSELLSLRIDAMSDGTTVVLHARDTSDLDRDAIDAYSKFVFHEPLTCDADDNRLNTGILSDLQDALTAQAIVEDNPTDLHQYGLDAPAAKLHITTNSVDATILVGNTDGEDGIYLMKEGGSTVFLSTASSFDFLREDWNHWRSTNLLPCALTELDRITVVHDDMVYEAVLTTVPEDENEDSDKETVTAVLNGKQLSDDALQQLYLAVSSVNYVRLVKQPETAEPEVTVTLKMKDGTQRSLAFAKGGSREYLVRVDDGTFAYGVRQADLTSILDALTAGMESDASDEQE